MEAALALSKLVTLNQSSLRCSPWSKAGTGVPVPMPASAPQVCEDGGEDLAVLTLRTGNGLALSGAFPDYVEAEQQARDAGLGIWHSDFVAPWEWRAGVQSLNRPSDSSRECNVKAVIGGDGQRLYFVPTDADYRALTIDPEQGEKMLCSDDQARSAGWRRRGEMASVDE